MKNIANTIAFDRVVKFTPNDDYSVTIVEKLSCERVKTIDDFIVKKLYEAYKDTDISQLFIIDETEFAKYLKATLPQYLKERKMKRTEKDIYDFVKKKLEEARRNLSYEVDDGILVEVSGNEHKIEAYEEVLNFIGTIRTKGE